MFKPAGIIPAMITPLREDQTIDEDAVRTMVNRFIRSGVHGLFCLGTNGEFFSMTEEEKVHLVRIVLEETAGRIPVYAGSGGINTKVVIDLSRQFEDMGVTALSVITPYFNPISQDELYLHYKSIASSVSIPILLYNIPSRTGINLDVQTVVRLSEIPNIVGIKDSSGNFDLILQYLETVDPEFSVLAGTDSLILWTLLAGGAGAVAATANVLPELVVSIYEHWQKGNLPEAIQAQRRLRPLRNMMQKGSMPSVFKEALKLLDVPAGVPRLPVLPASEALSNELSAMLNAYRQQGILSEELSDEEESHHATP